MTDRQKASNAIVSLVSFYTSELADAGDVERELAQFREIAKALGERLSRTEKILRAAACLSSTDESSPAEFAVQKVARDAAEYLRSLPQ